MELVIVIGRLLNIKQSIEKKGMQLKKVEQFIVHKWQKTSNYQKRKVLN
jgi:hypothetical protein